MATIENKEKEHKQSQQGEKQVFYFNDEGQLVVETNKGVWVDGEKFVKMRGEFVCNAKTIGEIIHQFKGIAVEVGELKYVNKEDVDKYGWGISYRQELVKSQTRCILGASQERIEEYEKELAKQKFVHERIEELQKQCEEYEAKIYDLNKSIGNFNSLPWWKRFFKKVKVK